MHTIILRSIVCCLLVVSCSGITHCAVAADHPTSVSATTCLYCDSMYINLGSRCMVNSTESELFATDWSEYLKYVILCMLLVQSVNTVISDILTISGKARSSSSSSSYGSQNNLLISALILSNSVLFNSVNGISNLSLNLSTLSAEISGKNHNNKSSLKFKLIPDIFKILVISTSGIMNKMNWIQSLYNEEQAQYLSHAISASLWIVYLLFIYFVVRVIIHYTEHGFGIFQRGIGSLLYYSACLTVNAAMFFSVSTLMDSSIYFKSPFSGANYLNIFAVLLSVGFSALFAYKMYTTTTQISSAKPGTEEAEMNRAFQKIIFDASPFLEQEQPKWIQKNYALIRFYRLVIIYPAVIAALSKEPVAGLAIIVSLQILAVAFSAYVRPMQDIFSNTIEVSQEMLFLCMVILKLSARSLANDLNAFNEIYDDHNIDTLNQIESIDISVHVILIVLISMLTMRSFHQIIATIIKIQKDKEAALVYVTRQLDSIERVQMQVFGFLQESQPCFKIRDDYLENYYMRQSFLHFMQKDRIAKTSSSFSPQIPFGSPDISKQSTYCEKQSRNSTINLNRMSPIRQSLPLRNLPSQVIL